MSGCLTIDAKLEQTGAGTATLVLHNLRGNPARDSSAILEGPHVTVEDVKLDGPKATYKLEFDDVTKLNTSRFFRGVSTSLTHGEGTTTLVSKVVGGGEAGAKSKTAAKDEKEKALAKDAKKKAEAAGSEKKGKELECTVTLTLPGEIVETNAEEKDGNTATWKISQDEIKGIKGKEFKVTYKQPKS
jgi:hypothetical protein